MTTTTWAGVGTCARAVWLANMHTNTRTVDKATAVLLVRLGMRGLLQWDRKSGRVNESLVWSSRLIPSSLEGHRHRVNTTGSKPDGSGWRMQGTDQLNESPG